MITNPYPNTKAGLKVSRNLKSIRYCVFIIQEFSPDKLPSIQNNEKFLFEFYHKDIWKIKLFNPFAFYIAKAERKQSDAKKNENCKIKGKRHFIS